MSHPVSRHVHPLPPKPRIAPLELAGNSVPPPPASTHMSASIHSAVPHIAAPRDMKRAGPARSGFLPAACVITAMAVLVACSNPDPTSTAYTPPATEAASDGWRRYVNAPMVDQATVGHLNPEPVSPEAAVTRFLSSRVRGDDAWKGAMVTDLSDRAGRALAEWGEWQLQRYQLRARKDPRSEQAYIRVFLEISVKGRTDSGEDEFELVREGGQWRIARPPA